MTPIQVLVFVFTGLSALTWLMSLLAVLKTINTMPLLEKLSEINKKNPPKISVIIPACNEAKTLEKAMETRLKDKYPNLEFILIDDRSDDNTREIARRIAAMDKRVKLICIDELPEGWLGKVHALHTGLKHAAGDWFLFSDADVYVKPGTLNRVMAYCQSEKLDHLAVIPEFYKRHFFVDATVSVFLKALMVTGRSWKIKDQTSRAFGGSGAFTIVRRSAFEKTKGFEWLKLEIIDDLTLGQMMKRSGGRSDMINGRGCVGVQWYPTFKEMAVGIGRALFVGIPNFSLTGLVLLSCFTFTLDMIPFVILIPMGIPYLPIAGLIIVLIAFSTSILTARFINLPLIPALFLPLGNIIVFFIALIIGTMTSIRGGIVWRGTFYSNKRLKEGRRFAL
jgi:glycosyltransferase involved in cell wall biosynthesis